MSITSTTPVAGAGQGAAPTAPASPFNGDAFMKLLLAQLKHQDPLNPMKDQEFMAQLAQMNTLSEIQKLNANIESMTRAQAISQGAGLIGKAVQATSGDRLLQGIVQSVRVSGNETMLDLGGTVVKLSEVQAVWEVNHDAV